MKKQHKWISLISVVLALAVSTVYPYVGVAEENDRTETKQEDQSQEADSAAAAEPSNTETAASGANDAKNTAQDATKVQMYPITATKKVAENSRYELYIDPKTANIRVVNKQTKKEWLGSPLVSRKTLPNNKKFMDSPVHVKYTVGADVTETYTLKKETETKLSVKNIDRGVRAEFDLSAINISFAVEYTLRDDGLEVTIPDESIKEKGAEKLVAIDVLPFFNAANETDDGAVFLPDGSGVLMVFRKNHPKYFSGYSEPVYGPDQAFKSELFSDIDQMWRRAKPPKELIALPVFGIYRNGTGFLGIITDGDEEAMINGDPAGIRNIPLYRASAEFVFRNTDVIFIGNSGQIPLFQGARIEGDRQLRFVLLEGDDANYVGMAAAYREYLVEERGVKPVVPEQMPLNVRLLGGILRDEIIGSTFIKMTTFEQARSIIDAYAAKGINSLQLTFSGWSKGGLYGNQPNHFPVEKQLGGSKDLKELVSYAKEKGVSIFLQANYVRPYEESDGFNERRDAIRGIDREVMVSFNHWIASRYNTPWKRFYLMKPEKVLNDRVKHELDDFAELGIAGVSLKYIGNMVYSDYDPKQPRDREQTVDAWVGSLAAFREKVGQTAVDYGFAYTLGHVDRIDNIPMDSSHFVYTDETVPFYQIALHGLLPYSAEPTNLRDDSRVELLRAVEYGAAPSFELTFDSPSKLQRTLEDRLFSSSFSYWLDPSVEEYNRFAEMYKNIGNQHIVNHERLDRHVYRTTYANGTQVIVNYGEQAASIDGHTVESLDYKVVGGGS
ncbi:DUF5696 domain-containing protein [Paenibacillus alkalitolerans]|uniref:DUF5696 domain-containing protein n=1 Tax=Paenibacillus alkalitolerans TaxID=2799335 RepID=UPI0018F327B5|nr:DUF5696 domain-containing protein [Paenibacillus alkalitolerans]